MEHNFDEDSSPAITKYVPGHEVLESTTVRNSKRS